MKAEPSSTQAQNEAGSFLKLNSKALLQNMAFLSQSLNPKTLKMAMVKAVAYGHGAVLLSTILEKNKLVDYLGVASIDKGIELRESGVELPIMVTNPLRAGFHKMVEHCLEPVLHSIELARDFSNFISQEKAFENYPIHLKFNTGMNRFGIDPEKIDDAIELIKSCNWKLKSVMSHLSCSDEPDQDEFTQGQFRAFDQIKEVIKLHFKEKVLFHILNTNGLIRFPEKQEDMVRIGIGLYGATEYLPARKNLHPIACFYTKISQIRRVKKGASISYSRSGIASQDTYIGTITVGYADGFPRSLGNGNWMVRIKGKLYPTIGNVCMDYTMVDLGPVIDNIEPEADVLIFGDQGAIYDYAAAQGTICYEAMTNLGNRVRRIFIED